MGPPKHDRQSPELQGRCGPRWRRCLRHSCERWFWPSHWLSRYCGQACRQAVRTWSQRLANQHYRQSERGKACRRLQAARYRQRCRERKQSRSSEAPGEGYQYRDPSKNLCCQRPGCYERFARPLRSPLKKFCSRLCRQALRRVLVRERRWREKLQGAGFFPGARQPEAAFW